MTLYQLEVFALVAKLQSFTRAAKELHVGQPSISALMIQLQKELGVKLFEKLGVKSHLTQAGSRFRQRTESILAMVQEAKDEMDEIKGLKKGKLLVGGSTLAASFFSAAIEKFKKAYPGIDIALKIDRSRVLEKKLEEREIDIAILSRPPASVVLQVYPYREEDIVAVTPPGHPLAKKRSVSLELLAQQPIVSGERGTSVVRDMVERLFKERGIPFKPVLEVNTISVGGDTIRNAILSGLGIGFISKCLVMGDVQSGRLKLLKVPELKLKRTLYIAVHKNRIGASPIRAFIDSARDH